VVVRTILLPLLLILFSPVAYLEKPGPNPPDIGPNMKKSIISD